MSQHHNLGPEFRKYATKHMGITSMNVHRFENKLQQQLPEDMTRSIILERDVNFREIDVFSKLMSDRIIFLGTPIDDYISNIITAQLLFLSNVDPKKDVTMYINSPGGGVYAGYGIRDTMNYIKPDVSTVATSIAASMGAILLASGAKGKRFCLPFTRVMLHQPLGGAQGQASDMEISVKQIKIIKSELYQIISDSLVEGKEKSLEQIEKDCDRDYWMKGQEAVDYGIIDGIVEKQQ